MNTPAATGTAAAPNQILAVPAVRVGSGADGRYRAPHVADLIVDELRRRILEGELDDGDELPRLETLLSEFGVSKPSMREALRILESEGLLSVRRGKIGGAIVHRPGSQYAAHTLGTVLRTIGAPVDDLSMALNLLEPQCVALCAARPDRAEAVLPRLRAIYDEASGCIDDVRRFTLVSRRFHEEIVNLCGSPTLTLVVGALESVWSTHADAWAEIHAHEGDYPDLDYRRQGLADHAAILDLIECGDAAGAEAEARRHLEWSPVYSVDDSRTVYPSRLSEQPPE